MTSIFAKIYLIRRSLSYSHIQSLKHSNLGILEQVRCAGHAKWQNIKNTKEANDLAKGKMISRYVQLVKKAIVTNNMQADPKLNSRLAEVLSEASKFNVPKATLERAIVRATNLKMYTVNIEIQGPNGCALIVRCETENVSLLRRDLKKLIRKHDANVVAEDTLCNMFKSQGFIRTATQTVDGRAIDEDFAEEAAIVADAQEVNHEISDCAYPSETWIFASDAETLHSCRAELEKQGFKVLSSEIELVPYRAVDFGSDTYEKLEELVRLIRSMDQVLDVFHNVAVPTEPQIE